MTNPITPTKESTMTTDHTDTGHDAEPATSPMDPIGIPPEAVLLNPGYRATHIGPPPGISDDDCGTPEVLIGETPEGFPVLADYWRPTPEQLKMLNSGGFIELRQYAPRMVMHSLTVYAAETTEFEQPPCAWCMRTASGTAWHNDGLRHPSCGTPGHGLDDTFRAGDIAKAGS